MRTFTAILLLVCILLTQASAQGAASPPVYDNFDNSLWNDTFDDSLWHQERDTGVLPKQENGYLTFAGVTTSDSNGAHLVAHKPAARTLQQLERFEARFLVGDDHQGDWASIGLNIDSPEIAGRYWWTSCSIGVHTDETMGSVYCVVSTWTQQQGVVNEYVSTGRMVDLGEWHTLAIEVDATIARFEYELDGEVIGTHLPDDAAQLLQSNNLSPRITTWNDTISSTVTRSVDDVRLPGVLDSDNFVRLPLIIN